MESIEQRADHTLLRVRVQPKASRNAIILEPDGRIRVTLTAPPVEGAANSALVELVAKTVKCPKSRVTVVQGEKSREKTVRIEGFAAGEVGARLGQQSG